MVKEGVRNEKGDELFYDYLINEAQTIEEKNLITSIRNDEKSHRKWFGEIYRAYTGEYIESTNNADFQRPSTYIEGVRKALYGELSAMERYRVIREGLPSRYYRDVVLRILTDEMKHATKYNYILYINIAGADTSGQSPVPPAKTSFTTE